MHYTVSVGSSVFEVSCTIWCPWARLCLRCCALYGVRGLICQVFYLDGQIAVFAGGGQLLDVSVHLRHGQTACALLTTAEDALQPRQNPLQLRVQVTAVIWKTHASQSTQALMFA